MINKYIIPAGLVVCIGIFIFVVQSGREELKTSSLKLDLVSQVYNEAASSSEIDPIYPDPEDDPKYLACTKADYDRADGQYDPIEAFKFGLKIQKAVEEEDIEGLFDLVDGELSYGPRRSYALNSPFKKLFKPDFKEKVLSQSPDCSPLGSRGYLIGSGSLWYRQDSNGQFHIFSMPAALAEKVNDSASVGWSYDGAILPTHCFSAEWISSDNYEAYAEQFSIANFDDFTANVGEYLGREVTSLKPISAWGKSISLVRSISDCTNDYKTPIIKDGYVWNGDEFSFRLLGEITNEVCNELAPSLNNTCTKAFAAEHSRYGGSIGVYKQYYVYGLFDLPELGPSIVPLKNFGSFNESLNWLNAQEKGYK